ncbi:MAG TPA: sugar nucleotide-binding protein [Gemmatirosa sp.]|nr:sugar nucleotide-binding protein [Gemmatirosa sp.]
MLAPAPPLELWGGVEPTINRVRGRQLRQLERNGHLTRLDDLERFAGLGLRAIRYPVLWEQHAPAGEDAAGTIDWSWADARLPRLRELGVRPIVGLVHHGSGPMHTSLLDPAFATGLAAFARQVAERYPWVAEWTPVNEPLTTARFSGLYGVWYPHGRDGRTFARALVTQCRAVQLAMREIRAVNPDARLVQTDDLGRITSTPALAYEAELQNERRWLAWDLLFGRVDREHPYWPWLLQWGIGEAELDAFLAAPCPPDVVGVNHYLTSDRFLDERLERHPTLRPLATHARRRGGPARFADVETARIAPDATLGAGPRLHEAWHRYGRPLAVTECHLGCTREEQLRWLVETWRSAQVLRREGADVRAVTVWSLLGAFDWNTLVTRERGFYEPGPFDVRGTAHGQPPRPTALATLARQLARGEEPDHPVLEQPGWWRRPDRLFTPTAQGRSYAMPTEGAAGMRDRSARPLVITGAAGTLGGAFARLCDVRGIPYHVLGRGEMDVTHPDAVHATLAALHPWAVINCAGWVRVDDAEREPDACLRANAAGPALLAAACARLGARLVAFSSDLVFGEARRVGPYVEHDAPSPLNVYGRSKAEMEARVLAILPEALVVRTSAFFGPWDAHNFVTLALDALAAGRPFAATSDVTVSPTYVVDLVHATLDLLIDGASGIWHLANDGAMTWAGLARHAAALAGVPTSTLEERPLAAQALPAPRPRYAVLGSRRGQLLPPLDDALARYLRHRALAAEGVPPGGERRRSFRPWRYQQAGGWV